jgi:DivIVA domain-containing protein
VPIESESPRPPATGTSAEDIAAKSFPTARRGLDAAAVHRYLMEVAATLRDARRREDVLRARLEDLERTDRRQPVAPLDEESLTAALGAETVRVLQSAREASREIAAKAEQRANALIADAESALAERSRFAEEEAEALLSRARAMVQEARDARRRILTDLAERRRTMQLQLEQLRAGKETLSEILDGVSGSIFSSMETVRARLEGAEQEARVSATAATAEDSDDSDLRIDEPPGLDEPTLSAELRASLAGQRSRLGNEARRSESSSAPSAHAKTQGIDELFARIRESRQLEVAETRKQMEAVEREIYASLPPEISGFSDLPTPPSSPARFDIEPPLEPEPPVAASPLFSEVEERREEPEPRPSISEDRREEPAPTPPAAEERREERAPTPPAPERDPSPQAAVEAPEPASAMEEEHGDEPDEGDDADEAEPTLFEQRDDLLSPAAGELSRALKRSLREEQNELLDAGRHLKRTSDAVALLPGEKMTDRVASAVGSSLDAAWRAGELFVDAVVGPSQAGQTAGTLQRNSEVADIGRALAEEIVEPIRRRMEAGLEHAGSDDGAVNEAIGSAFRDWRAGRIDEVAGDYTHQVFARAIVHSSRARNSKVRWLVDDGELECPDCDDNALAGPAIAGSLFPTGHSHPPVHSGCRCILVPISR